MIKSLYIKGPVAQKNTFNNLLNWLWGFNEVKGKGFGKTKFDGIPDHDCGHSAGGEDGCDCDTEGMCEKCGMELNNGEGRFCEECSYNRMYDAKEAEWKGN